ncbi:long-chain fatty acid--CoA ligase [Alicyclobacillus sp. SO9]|uniref:AMP-dependent synthetase/ligase n=1 Tax=Alicyclobacillus sp. SO9 TaxID=2665646 RepID=UPI0018E8F398|nr:long-chain fatty acid--CoA ligase [Alicyclobacillus sp. SO9]QQE80233.1 long-chain fatty acid--CoA ligase [Alicyclobacillus sp. SO9]
MRKHRNLLEMTANTVERYGDKTAFWNPRKEDGYQTWTYSEFWNDIRKVAGRLHEMGVEPGDKIGLISESRAWWPITDLAVMSLGAVTVPVFPNVQAEHVFDILNHAEVKGIFLQDGAQIEKVLALQNEWTTNITFICAFETALDGNKDLERRISDAGWAYYHFFDWLDKPHVLEAAAWMQTWQRLDRDDLATLVYTSGTTGKPKGVKLTHGNLLANVEGISTLIKIHPTDRSISYLPLSHIFERTASQWYQIYNGASIVYSRGINEIVSEFAEMPPTVFTTVPRLLEKVHEGVYHKIKTAPLIQRWLFRRAVKAGIKARVEKRFAPFLSLYDALVFRKIRQLLGDRLRLIVVGGAPLAPHIFEFFTALGIAVVEGYGLTETSPVIAANPVSDSRKGTVGKVLPNVELEIADDGEIVVRGDSISSGYYKNEKATEESFLDGGWFRTGDIGLLTDDRYLKITDRKKNLLVLSTGKNVAPAPVESAILGTSLIEQVLLVGNGRKFVSAIVVPDAVAVRRKYQRQHSGARPLDWPDEEELRQMLMHQIKKRTVEFAEYEQPKAVILAREPFTIENELLTPTLKVRAKKVLEVYANEIDALYSGAQKDSKQTGSKAAGA